MHYVKTILWIENLYKHTAMTPCLLGVLHNINRRQIDITTYQLLFFLSDTSLCLFGDEMYARILHDSNNSTSIYKWFIAQKEVRNLKNKIWAVDLFKRPAYPVVDVVWLVENCGHCPWKSSKSPLQAVLLWDSLGQGHISRIRVSYIESVFSHMQYVTTPGDGIVRFVVHSLHSERLPQMVWHLRPSDGVSRSPEIMGKKAMAITLQLHWVADFVKIV